MAKKNGLRLGFVLMLALASSEYGKEMQQETSAR